MNLPFKGDVVTVLRGRWYRHPRAAHRITSAVGNSQISRRVWRPSEETAGGTTSRPTTYGARTKQAAPTRETMATRTVPTGTATKPNRSLSALDTMTAQQMNRTASLKLSWEYMTPHRIYNHPTAMPPAITQAKKGSPSTPRGKKMQHAPSMSEKSTSMKQHSLSCPLGKAALRRGAASTTTTHARMSHG